MNNERTRGTVALKIILAIALLSGATGGARQAWADDPPAPEPVESYYANPAQAAHAAQLAEQSVASNQDVQTALNDFEEAQADFDAAQADVDAAQAELDALEALITGEPTPEEAAKLAAAEDKLEAKMALLDVEETDLTAKETAYTEVVAEVTGVVSADIAALRASGMGWGEIAHEIGVHPSTLGLGHAKKAGTQLPDTTTATGIAGIAPEELAEATARNTGAGKAKGHGETLQSGTHELGTGLSSSAVSGGIASSESKAGRDTGAGSQGKSNAGGNDKSNGADSSNAGGNSGKSGDSDNSNASSGGNGKADGNDSGKGNSGGNDKGGGNDNGKGNSGGNDKGNGKD